MEFFLNKLVARPQRSIICLSLLLLLAGSWILPLTDRDEARFSEASREMIQRGDYIVPWFNGEWRLYKPVLSYWCQIVSYKIFGANEFTARLPSIFFTTATALLLVRWGRKVADNKTAFIAGAMYVAGLHIALIGRVATADLVMIFFFTLATYSGWELTRPECQSRQKWWWIFYVSLALGFLGKGPEALFPLVGMILGRIFRKDSFRLPVFETVTGVCVMLALVGMWGIPALVQTNGRFWSFGMGEQVYQRAIDVNNSHGMSGFLGFVASLPFYFLTFFGSFFPWALWVPASLGRWWPERRRDDLGWFLMMNAAIVFIAFTLVRTKLPHYTAPAFPLIALWLAQQLGGQPQFSPWFRKCLAGMVIFILAITLGLFTYARSHLLTQNLWEATRAQVKPETKIGCFVYVEPSLVWKFRSVSTNDVTLGTIDQANDFLTNAPPYIIVVPTADLAKLSNTNGLHFAVHGIDLVRFKNRDLTAIVR